MVAPREIRRFGRSAVVKCPKCGFEGRISLDCPDCPYHETHNLKRILEERSQE